MQLVFSDASGCYELVPYANPAFPVYILKDHLCNSPGYRVAGHCHADFELVGILSGIMDYYVDGRLHSLKEGDVIFTNSRHFHYAHLQGKQDCWFVSVLFHPSILCEHAWLAKQWMDPLLSENAADCIHLPAHSQTARELIDLMHKASRHYQTPRSELKMMAVLYDILDILCGRAASQEPFYDDQNLKQFQIMNSYALKHLCASVREVAKAGNMGITNCNELFKKYTGLPPAKYLSILKIKQAETLLKTTDLNQTQIALECGYASPSYFCQCFKKTHGISPTRYRRELANAQEGM